MISAQAKHGMTKFNCERQKKKEKLAIVVDVPGATQNLVISCFCFAEDGKEIY